MTGVSNCLLGGHSHGGALASRFADENPWTLLRLALWAAYPAESNNLSDSSILGLSIYGTLDGLASQAEINSSRALLLDDTTWWPIRGAITPNFCSTGIRQGITRRQSPGSSSRSSLWQAWWDF
jgi:hypothetical protein